MKKHHLHEIYLSLLIAAILLGTVFGLMVRKAPVNYTSNQTDCLSRGGKYYLSIEAGSDYNYETCDINKELKY